MEEINKSLNEAKDLMDKALKHTSHELGKVRAGKVLPSLVDELMVMYYGSPVPMSQVATINNLDARTLVIKPWEKSSILEIEKAIKNSDLGINPQNDGDSVRITVPPLSEERRKNLVKQAKQEVEEGKIRVRNIRKETNDDLKKLQKNGIPEDAIKGAETKVQTLTDTHIKKLDEMLVTKEQEIMTV